jgi:hypothetical protein
MTVEHDDIEAVLGPLRDSHGRDRRLLWLSDMPERVFTQSSEAPVCDWLGDGSRAELLVSSSGSRRTARPLSGTSAPSRRRSRR